MLKRLKSVSMMLFLMGASTGAAYAVSNPGITDVKIAQQDGACTGIVKDATGETVIGASVVVKGTTNGTITGIDGDFSLSNVKKGDVIVISFVGYISQEIVWDGKPVNVTLKDDTQTLDEVVVVGYGTQKKVNVTGAVGMVDSKVIAARPVQNVSQALQGVIPGLNLTVGNSGGSLDGEMNINIRGTGTIGDGSGSSPLVLIDGIEGNLNTVNPNDIESVSVLKDAASASIYGARASFGVILVTTKSGKSGKTNVNYSGNVRFNDAIGIPELMDSYTFAQYFNRASSNRGGGDIFSPAVMERIKAYQEGTLTATTVDNGSGIWQKWANANGNTDWFGEFYDNWVPSQEHNLSISGGTEKLQYVLSGSFLDQKGLLRHGTDKFQRYTLNSKITANITDWLKVTLNSKWTREDFQRPTYLTSSFFHNLARKWPVHPAYDPNGFPMDEGEIEQMENGGEQNSQKDYYTNQLHVVIEPIKNWRINLEGSVRTTTQYQHWEVLPVHAYDVNGDPYYTVWDMGYGSYSAGSSRVDEYSWKENYYTTNIYSDYFKQFDNGHYFKVMAGFNAELYKKGGLTGFGTDLITPSVPELNTTQDNKNAYNSASELAIAGFFGRINYNYKERYLLEANLRYDGSSRFIGDKRWGLFPSFSVGWNISREEFFKPLSNIIGTLKLRGSWGQLGNNETEAWYPFFQSMPTGTTNSGWLINGVRQNTAGLPGIVSSVLTWETVESWNVGVDFGLFDNRLTGSFDYYQRYTYDMVGPAPTLPGILGASAPKINNADMKSYGWEMELSWRDRIEDFNYGVRFTLADGQRKVLKYPNESGDIYSWYNNKLDGTIWGYTTVGIAQTQEEMNAHLANNKPNWGSNWGAGDIMYADLNGDGEVTSGSKTLNDHGDLKVIGNSYARYNFGFTVDGSWRGLDFSIFLQGTMKRDYWLDGPYFWGASGDEWQSACFTEHLDYWTPDHTNAYYPKPYFGNIKKNQEVQSGYLQNAACLRVKNVQVGYTLPKSWTKKAAMESCLLYTF